ncbi:helix-turn-helix transcriptional regulator [Rhodococcus sp. BH5]|uniref:helix-turn-helix transcriptional regulator n=1 Tax=Rhodococcus sp. BH5 TaxID=2871702 RepID=UPI0022CD4630|nr:helix-turn-helix transcriptional regulator [Rhodococcus sp. BH5]MCZ9635280.1 helix-turn-helix transcriptional regulator [Rhodococcus sp. BH5]
MTSKSEDVDVSAGHPEMPWEQNFANQMLKLRSALGLNQTELARRISLWGLPFHQQTIQRIESGQRPVRLNEANVIADTLGTTVSAMISEMGVMDRQIIYRVDRLRYEATTCNEELKEMNTRLLSTLSILAGLVGDEMKKANGGPVSETLKWSYGWMTVGGDAYDILEQARLHLRYLTEGGEAPTLWSVKRVQLLDQVPNGLMPDELTFDPPVSRNDSPA